MIPGLTSRRWLFWVYVPLLFTATHWPNAKLPMTGRPDLVLHLTIFGVWTGLLIGAAFFGAALSWRNILWCAAIGAVYSGVDEALQAIPAIRRNAAWDDWGANLLGVAAATIVAILIRRVALARERGRGEPAPGGQS